MTSPEIFITKATEADAPYIAEKIKNYLLDSTNANWRQFFVAKRNNKTVAFGRTIDHGDFFEVASLGVDYYHRKQGTGLKMLLFLVEEAKRLNPQKAIYGVTHRPGFLKRAGFKEALEQIPQPLEYKKQHKCKDPSKIKIMRFN